MLNGMFIRDDVADVLKIAICAISALSLVYTWSYLRERNLYKGEVPVLMLFAVSGMLLLVSAGSLVMVYLGLEMLSLCSYALVAIDRDSPVASEAGMKYFVLGSLASGMLLYGMSLIYGALVRWIWPRSVPLRAKRRCADGGGVLVAASTSSSAPRLSTCVCRRYRRTTPITCHRCGTETGCVRHGLSLLEAGVGRAATTGSCCWPRSPRCRC